MNGKTLIIYATHEMSENLLYFCRNGYIDDPKYDFIFVFNNPTLKLEFIPKKANIKVVNRENIGIDFGGWTHVLHMKDRDGKSLHENYDYFVLVNSTIRGPFFPTWYDQQKHGSWPELFISKLNNDIKLVGTTINGTTGVKNPLFPHVQSMFLVFDRIGLNIGISKRIFDPRNINMSKARVIFEKEIGLSKAIIEAGYNIASILPSYKDIDFRKPIPPNFKRLLANHYVSSHIGSNINPFEVIFFKTNIGISPTVLQRYTEWNTKKSNLNGILKISYGISESESIDVTQKMKDYLQKNPVIYSNFNINQYLQDHYIGQLKKLFVSSKDGQIIIINEACGYLRSNVIVLG